MPNGNKDLIIEYFLHTVWRIEMIFDADKNEQNIRERDLRFEQVADFDFSVQRLRLMTATIKAQNAISQQAILGGVST